MSGFSEEQQAALEKKLQPGNVSTRDMHGRSVSYIEGWFAIAEANAIFGFDGWDRETLSVERVVQTKERESFRCGYSARVRIRVRTNSGLVLREGSGFGIGAGADAAEAHEQAIKAAETDATKRALATFGNRFGLALYDPEQQGVAKAKRARMDLFAKDGALLARGITPELYCAQLKEQITACSSPEEAGRLRKHNAAGLRRLKEKMPALTNSKGVHFGDILERMLSERCLPVPNASGVINKTGLMIAAERRVRDKAHLGYVAAQPCLICEQTPCHAHHLRFAQPRGMSLKVSDEFTVPLCAIHHNALHQAGSEPAWWHNLAIDPLPIAQRLWRDSHALADG